MNRTARRGRQRRREEALAQETKREAVQDYLDRLKAASPDAVLAKRIAAMEANMKAGAKTKAG